MAKPLQSDLDEFGTDAETGAPCIGKLIAALPEDRRDAYREERRAFVREMSMRGSFVRPTTK